MDSNKRYDRLKYRDMRENPRKQFIDGGYLTRRKMTAAKITPQPSLHQNTPAPEGTVSQHENSLRRFKLKVNKLSLPQLPKPYIKRGLNIFSNRRLRAATTVLIVLMMSVMVLFSNVAQAAVSLRATGTKSVNSEITPRVSLANNNGGGSGSLDLDMPSGTVEGDVIIAGLAIKGGGNTSITTVPSGWSLLDQKRDTGSGTTHITQVVYYKVATAGESGPYQWQFTSNKASGVIISITNVDSNNPIDTSLGQVNASSATVTAPSITTANANEQLVGIFGTSTGTNQALLFTGSTMDTFSAQSMSTGGGAGSRTGSGLGSSLQAAAGSTGTKTATADTAAVNIGHLIAIKPSPANSLSLPKPTGTVQNDVMIAAITIRGGSGVTITAPNGWTSIQNTNTAGNEIKTQSWYKVASGSEGSSYTWTWTGARAASGVVASYSGVDPNTPIDTSGSQANSSATTHTAPSITPTNGSNYLVVIYGISNSYPISSTSPLTDRGYSASSGSSNLTATRIADEQLRHTGATGSRIVTTTLGAASVGQQVALLPHLSTLTQASHRWFGQDERVAGINWINHPSAVENQWTSVTYGNGLFVATSVSGTGNRVMTSPDGITWTARTSAADNVWRAVTYGNGLFVATSDNTTGTINNRVMTSPDGITWTARTAAMNSSFKSIVYGNGQFVALAEPGGASAVMTSPDGINWTPQSNPAIGNSWRSVTYGNGMFVAVDNSDSNGAAGSVMTSPDGINWTARTAAADNAWLSVTFGNGTFVATSSTSAGTINNRVMTSPDGITWTARTAAANNSWASVSYGNGMFVAVSNTGTGNRVMTSPDGITWTARTSAADNSWGSVAFGGGKFVAISFDGSGNRVMTSDAEIIPTASTWTSRTSAEDSSWKSVAYGNDLFVAVGSGGVMTSPDGFAWTLRTAPTAGSFWYSVTYGNGLFVAVSLCCTNSVMTSPDGITWTLRTAPAANNWYSVTYGNGLFVAISGDGTNRVMTSTDGITWTPRTAAAANNWIAVTYGNGLFVAVSSDGTNRVMTSPDGITWTARTAASANTWNDVTYGNGLFVATSTSGTGDRVMTSPDGITWTSRTSATDNNWSSVIYGNGLFVAVSETGTGDRTMTAPAVDASAGTTLGSQDAVLTNTTSDSVRLRMNAGVAYKNLVAGDQKFALQYATRSGSVCSGGDTFYNVGTASWSARTAAVDNNWTSVTYGNGIFVAVTYNGTGNRVMTSYDGITWTSRSTTGLDKAWYSVTYGNGLFVAVGLGTAQTGIMTSPDGINWTGRTEPGATSKTWYSVTYGNGIFVAVADGGTNNGIMTSSDGVSWTLGSSSAASTLSWKSVTYGNGLFVAVTSSSASNQVMTSSDGINWTRQNTPLDLSWNSIAYGNGLFVAVASNGTNGFMTSPDGINWTARSSSADNSATAVGYSGKLFVTISGSTVRTSPDGITWTSIASVANNVWSSIAYGNGVFVAVASSGNITDKVMSMSPPISWGGQLSNNYGAATSNGSDPTQGGSTIRKQNYVTNNYFSSNIDTAIGEYAMWDFDLDLSGGTYESSYCFRIVNANGSLLNTYSTYPEITKCTAPSLDRRLRHGAAFCGNVKRFYWTRATS
jgi:hypothetical protein